MPDIRTQYHGGVLDFRALRAEIRKMDELLSPRPVYNNKAFYEQMTHWVEHEDELLVAALTHRHGLTVVAFPAIFKKLWRRIFDNAKKSEEAWNPLMEQLARVDIWRHNTSSRREAKMPSTYWRTLHGQWLSKEADEEDLRKLLSFKSGAAVEAGATFGRAFTPELVREYLDTMPNSAQWLYNNEPIREIAAPVIIDWSIEKLSQGSPVMIHNSSPLLSLLRSGHLINNPEVIGSLLNQLLSDKKTKRYGWAGAVETAAGMVVALDRSSTSEQLQELLTSYACKKSPVMLEAVAKHPNANTPLLVEVARTSRETTVYAAISQREEVWKSKALRTLLGQSRSAEVLKTLVRKSPGKQKIYYFRKLSRTAPDEALKLLDVELEGLELEPEELGALLKNATLEARRTGVLGLGNVRVKKRKQAL